MVFPERPQKLQIFIPWLFGDKLEHVKVNGWANGWKIAGNQQKTKNNKQQTGFGQLIQTAQAQSFGELVSGNTESVENVEIVLVYWPQYLQWLGLGLLGLSGGVILALGMLKFPYGKRQVN